MRARIVSILALTLFMTVMSLGTLKAECKYKKGENVDVKWKGTWYDSAVRTVKVKNDTCHYKIHYNGWSNSWDEVVTASRMRKK